MKQKSYETLSFRFNAEITKMLTINIEKTMIIDVVN